MRCAHSFIVRRSSPTLCLAYPWTSSSSYAANLNGIYASLLAYAVRVFESVLISLTLLAMCGCRPRTSRGAVELNQIVLWFRRGRKMAILVVVLMAAWSQCRADEEAHGAQLYRSASGPCVTVPSWKNSPGCHACVPAIAGSLRECRIDSGTRREPIGPAVYVGTVTMVGGGHDAEPITDIRFRALANQPPPVVANQGTPTKTAPFPSVPPPPQIGVDPVFGPMCAGPLRPGPCQDVHRFLLIQAVADGMQLQQIGIHPQDGPLCAGPMGPGPCQEAKILWAVLQVAMQQVQIPTWRTEGICLGPLGPGPCGAVRAYIMRAQSAIGRVPLSFSARQPQLLPLPGPNFEPMCAGPFGPAPCALIAQVGLDMMGGNLPPPGSFNLPPGVTDAQKLAQECARRIGLDVASFAACAGQKMVLPSEQQAVLDCAVTSRTTQAFAACAAQELGYSLSTDQQKVAGCAIKAGGGEADFKTCLGGAFLSKVLSADEQAILKCATNSIDAVAFGECAAGRFMSRSQKSMLDCAVSASDVTSFATCAAPHSGIKMSEDQRVLANCAMKAKGDKDDFATCVGAAFLGKNLGPNEQKVLGCAASAGGDTSKFAACSATALFGDKLSKEQQVAVQCAAQSQGDPTGFATCAGVNMFNMQLNPEQQIAVQCVVSTGGQPHAAAGCIGSRLTARELGKCLSHGIGGEDGCFGDNNDLVGKNGWVGRTLGQIPGVINPAQIWGGDNSFVRNPGQIWGGSNSFVRNPSQIWGGPNSVFNNPGQLLPEPKPVQIGSIAGKRICLPWC